MIWVLEENYEGWQQVANARKPLCLYELTVCVGKCLGQNMNELINIEMVDMQGKRRNVAITWYVIYPAMVSIYTPH